MRTYEERKNEVKKQAIQWQLENEKTPMSLSEVLEVANHFYTLAKKYGLLHEFRQNGIIGGYSG